MSHRSVLTDNLRERMEAEMASGVPVKVVADRCAVPTSTVFAWLKNGRIVRRNLSIPLPTPPTEPDTAEPTIAARLREAEPRLLDAIVKAATDGEWRAAAWVLERANPDVFAPQSKAPPVPRKDAFSDLDSLAKRRAA